MTKPYVVTAEVTLSRPNSVSAELDLRILLAELKEAGQIQTFSVTDVAPGEGNEGK